MRQLKQTIVNDDAFDVNKERCQGDNDVISANNRYVDIKKAIVGAFTDLGVSMVKEIRQHKQNKDTNKSTEDKQNVGYKQNSEDKQNIENKQNVVNKQNLGPNLELAQRFEKGIYLENKRDDITRQILENETVSILDEERSEHRV